DVATDDGRGGSDDHTIGVDVISPLSGSIVLSAATEHVALAPNTTVATFTDTDTRDAATAFSATINWGDGNITAGVVTGSNGSFTVSGGHTYDDEGGEFVSATIVRNADNIQISPSGFVSVADNDSLTGTGTSFAATATVPFSGTVATFTDSDT